MKVLFIDIETFANKGYFWDGLYEQNIPSVIEYGTIASFAYKWGHEKSVHGYSLYSFKNYARNKKNSRELLLKIHKLLSEADIVVAHNGDKFDIKKINALFLKNGIPQPSPYVTIDTLKVARANLKLPSYKLDYIADYFNIGRKVSHSGFNMWIGCENGNTKDWNSMLKYNKHDVLLLEKVFLLLKPLIKNYPTEIKRVQCKRCSSWSTKKHGKRIFAIKGLAQCYSCNSCGHRFNT